MPGVVTDSLSNFATNDVEHARTAVRRFLQVTGLHKHFGARTHPAVRDAVFETIESWNLQLPDSVWRESALTSLDIATTSYRATTIDQQIAIALWTFFAVIFDDNVIGLDAMREFVPRFYKGLPQTHPALARYVEVTLDLAKHYSSTTANSLISSTMEFANTELFTRECGEKVGLHLQKESSGYIEQVRLKDGVAEGYAICIWPHDMCPDVTAYIQAIPDASLFINYVNDLFSFYKEIKSGETKNYLSRYGQVHGRDTSQVLQDLVDKILTSMENIKALLPEGTNERDAWEHCAAGYVQFHVQSKRYRLNEILPEYTDF